MLHAMEPSVQTQPSPASSSFAGMLAALALPSREATDGTTAWSDSDLGEDVATLSYERALRTHARYKPADRGDWQFTQGASPVPVDAREEPSRSATPAGEGLTFHASAAPQDACDRDLRSASVTIRLSKTEYERLRQRAAEAGVTVSAYLRSCTFDAEALRAQVKTALAELRSAASKEKPAEPVKQRRSWFGWMARVLLRRSSAERADKA